MKLREIRVDGYKNLINCRLELGDFNVLVGPNNSGKSNLLEAIQMLSGVCFGGDETRNYVLRGMTPPGRSSSSICHLEKYKNRALAIGVTFETRIKNKTWRFSYDVRIKCDNSEKRSGHFLSETLTAKPIGKRGQATAYISREGTNLEVLTKSQPIAKKSHPIAKDYPALQAIRSLYPEFKGLPPEFERFYWPILWAGTTRIFGVSPKTLREDMDSEKSITGFLASSFDLLFIADEIKKEGTYYELFKDSLCDILDLQEVFFRAEDIPVSTRKDKIKEKSKRMRALAIKRAGDISSELEEFSDGTLAVVAILEALLSKDVRGPILCLEELENFLHPAAIAKLLRFLQDNAHRWPVLITTHSPYLLNSVNPSDVNVAVSDKAGGWHFEKIRDRKALDTVLKSKFMNFGDFLVSNYEDFLGVK